MYFRKKSLTMNNKCSEFLTKYIKKKTFIIVVKIILQNS